MTSFSRPARFYVSVVSTSVILLMVATRGCQSYGSGPQPKTDEDKIAACGVLPTGYRERIQSQQQGYAQNHLSPSEQRTLKIDVGEAYRARSYRGLLSYGRFKYGWAVPVTLVWTTDDGKPRTIRDVILLFPGEVNAPVASTIPGLQIEKLQ